jgi:hypothetical protein
MKQDMKERGGTYRWEVVGEVERPRMVHCVAIKAGDDVMLAQATVLTHSTQVSPLTLFLLIALHSSDSFFRKSPH